MLRAIRDIVHRRSAADVLCHRFEGLLAKITGLSNRERLPVLFEALKMSRESPGGVERIGEVLGNLMESYATLGDPLRAASFGEESAMRAVGGDFSEMHLLPVLGESHLKLGETQRARAVWERYIVLAIVVFGTGSAGVGIADLIALAMTEDGLSADEAAARIYLLDRPGLLMSDLTDLYEYQQTYAKDPSEVAGWRASDGTLGLQQVVDNLHPTMLAGTSGVTGAFTEDVITSMLAHCARPIILPMSNPTVLAEQTPANLLAWTDGAALVATGSPFEPVDFNGTTYRIGQANNALMFPGLGLGVIVCRAATMPPSLFIAAARALAKLADPSDPARACCPTSPTCVRCPRPSLSTS